MPSVRRGGGELVQSHPSLLSGFCGGGIGEHGVSGGVPASADEFEEVDDQHGGLFVWLILFGACGPIGGCTQRFPKASKPSLVGLGFTLVARR